MDRKATSVVAYLTWIGLLIAFVAGDREGAKFHLNQALVICIGYFIASFVFVIPVLGWLVGAAAYIFLLVCTIMGIISALNGEEKELPLIGSIKLLK